MPVYRGKRGDRDRHDRAVGCDGREVTTDERGFKRTVKSFGSDAPMQASTRDEANASPGDGVTKSRVTRTISYKP